MYAEISAEYVDHMGDDLRVVNSARVSFDQESKYEGSLDPELVYALQLTGCPGDFKEKTLSERDVNLISYLARHGHWTPFSHPQITLRETVPIFVARQRFKHMVGFTYNEVSRRYVDSEPEFYAPKKWRKRADNKKQGSSAEAHENSSHFDTAYAKHIGFAKGMYEGLILQGVCPEQARMVLPQSMMTSYYVTGSLAAWVRAFKLRIDEHSQKEIQDLAKHWCNIIRPLFPVSWKELTNNG